MILTNTKRIEVIDALRGFVLLAICLLHCMEHFECYVFPETDSLVLKWFDTTIGDFFRFIFAGKSYAIFSLLFGVSFFIQMDNQAQKGKDFRLRFMWRLAILYVFGFINGLLYFGEIFEVYAVLGLLLIPLYKIPTRWLMGLCIILLFQIPNLIWFGYMTVDPTVQSYPFLGFKELLFSGYFGDSNATFLNGSFSDVISYNFWSEGRMLKWAWIFWSSRAVQIVGLFVAGMLIGRFKIHKSEEKMLKYSKKAIGIGSALFSVFYCIKNILPLIVNDNPLMTELGQMTFTYYIELGQMLILIGVFLLTYFNLGGKNALNKLAPVGRMSVTNYMAQSLIGTILFYGFGFGLAETTGPTYAALIGIILCAIQILYCNWWMKRFYYGPLEWLWRSLTWCSFKNIPFVRKSFSPKRFTTS